jgi:hypothetical protein
MYAFRTSFATGLEVLKWRWTEVRRVFARARRVAVVRDAADMLAVVYRHSVKRLVVEGV